MQEAATHNELGQRAAGVLLHPTCLPSPFGIGDLGPGAYRYLEWLVAAGVRWWQILPLNPPGPGNSPYSAISTFAGNPLLISPQLLVEDGLLRDEELASAPDFVAYAVDYQPVAAFKDSLLRVAFDRFRDGAFDELRRALAEFAAAEAGWLEDFSVFAALRQTHRGAMWRQWPRPLAFREEQALHAWRSGHSYEIDFVSFCQFLFFRQWRRLQTRARELGLRILGDLPIFVAMDSAEVWAHPELFSLDEERQPTVVAGVPPDYFSATGQLWGNPLYDWQRLAGDGYRWWVDRLRHALQLSDAVRLDHFRGFVAHWEVPAGDDVASNGRWVEGPGRAFFDAVKDALGALPLVAEDLGEITPDVIALRRTLGLPGMAVLHFAFDPQPRSSFIPYHLERDLVVYTGTHDNNTTVGWFLEDANDGQRELLRRYVGSDCREVHWDLVRQALAAVCDLAIVPHQDLAGVGSDCRMNTPGVGDGNWRFRITEWMLDGAIQRRLGELVETYGRAPAGFVPPAGPPLPAEEGEGPPSP